jgi:carbonic anhydrase
VPHSLDTDVLSPDAALARLRAGNDRFVAGEGGAARSWHAGLTLGQRPFAVVLGCSDSRAPAEYVFDQGLGDLFVIRVAGNVIAPSLVGSVEFAVGSFGTRLVVVMGHTQCGAVGATVHALEHGEPESANLRSIVERITPHVRPIFDQPGGSVDHDARLAAAVRANAVASARELREASPIVHDLVERGRVVVTPAVYDLSTGVVTFLDA